MTGPSDAYCRGDNSPKVLLAEIERLVKIVDRYYQREQAQKKQTKGPEEGR